MKRFMGIIVLFSVSILAVWAIFGVFAVSPAETKSDNTSIKVQVETDEMLKANISVDPVVPVTGEDMMIAPLIDTTGAVESDPTGTIWSANHSADMAVPVTGMDIKISPIFDSAGAIVSDPTGTMLSEINP